MHQRQQFGQAGEAFAAEVLKQSGYVIVERNYRCAKGEIDIIAERDEELFFIEVKTRRGSAFGFPCEAVTETKKQHMRRAAASFLSEHSCRWTAYSFQVIEVGFHQIENVF